MWRLVAPPDSGTAANVWFLLATLVTTLGAIASTVIAVWHTRRSSGRSEITAAVEDAIEEYRETFTDPLREENKQLRKQLDECRRRKPTP